MHTVTGRVIFLLNNLNFHAQVCRDPRWGRCYAMRATVRITNLFKQWQRLFQVYKERSPWLPKGHSLCCREEQCCCLCQALCRRRRHSHWHRWEQYYHWCTYLNGHSHAGQHQLYPQWCFHCHGFILWWEWQEDAC